MIQRTEKIHPSSGCVEQATAFARGLYSPSTRALASGPLRNSSLRLREKGRPNGRQCAQNNIVLLLGIPLRVKMYRMSHLACPGSSTRCESRSALTTSRPPTAAHATLGRNPPRSLKPACFLSCRDIRSWPLRARTPPFRVPPWTNHPCVSQSLRPFYTII